MDVARELSIIILEGTILRNSSLGHMLLSRGEGPSSDRSLK